MKKSTRYLCKTGKHDWCHLEDAKKCCNGYVPVWEDYLPDVKIRRLKPASDLMEMDEKSSNTDQTNHLYRAQ